MNVTTGDHALRTVLILACLNAACSAPPSANCSALARQYDLNLRQIELAAAVQDVPGQQARDSDRTALLSTLGSNNCPSPSPVSSSGYQIDALKCSMYRGIAELGNHLSEWRTDLLEMGIEEDKLPQPELATAEKVGEQCDVTTWVYYPEE